MELNKRDFLKAIGGIAALTTTGSVSAQSGQQTDGEFELEEFARSYLENDDVLDNQELETLLHQLESENPELVTVDQIGQSNQGRPLYAVHVGKKKKKNPGVMGIAQQHGDEYFMAEGLLAVAQFLTSGDPRAERILANRSVHLVPRVNPDGFVVPHRYNIDPEAPEDDPESGIFQGGSGIFAASEPGVGWDINRYNRHDWTQHELYQNFPEEYPENPVPEAVAVHELMADVDPEWVIDFHRMGGFMVDYESEWPGPEWARDDTDDDSEDESEEFTPPDPNDPGDGFIGTGAMLWPLHEDVDPEIRELSKQLVVTMRDDLLELDTKLRRVEYARYPGGTYSGIARNGHALAGYGSVLVEVAGGTLGDRIFRARQPFDAMLAAAEATADGSLYTVDAGRVDELPEAASDVAIEESGAE